MRAHPYRVVLLAIVITLALASCSLGGTTGGNDSSDQGIWVKTKQSQRMSIITHQADDDNKTERDALVSETNYVIDEQGNITSYYSTTDGFNYSRIDNVIYTRDENGFMLTKESDVTHKGEGTDLDPEVYSYVYERDLDDAGRVTRFESRKQSNNPEDADTATPSLVNVRSGNYCLKYTYDAAGKIASVTTIVDIDQLDEDDRDTTETQTDVYDYDEHGLYSTMQSTTEKSVKGEKPVVTVTKGNMTWEFSEDGKPVKSKLASNEWDSTEDTLYTYDDNGNVASSRFDYESESDGRSVRTETTYEWTYIEHPSLAARTAASVFLSDVEL